MNTRFIFRAAALVIVAVLCSMAEPLSNATPVCLSGASAMVFHELLRWSWCVSPILIAALLLTVVQLTVYARITQRTTRDLSPRSVSRSLWGWWGIGTTLACAAVGIAASLWTPASDAHVFQAYVLAVALTAWGVERARTDAWLRRVHDALAMTASVVIGLAASASVVTLGQAAGTIGTAHTSWHHWTPWLAAPLVAWLYRVRARWVSRTPEAFAHACRQALGGVSHANTLEDLTARVLLPFTQLQRNKARGRPDESTEPMGGYLLSMDPPRQATLNHAGFAVVSALTPPAEVVSWLAAHTGAVVTLQGLERQAVRLPEVRPILAQLHEWDALCATPLGRNEELVGVLALPNYRRPSALSLYESEALQSLGAHVCAHLDLWCALARSQAREQLLQRERKHALQNLEALAARCQQAEQDDQARWQAWWSAASASAEPAVTIAYSAAMQRALAIARERLDATMPLLVLSAWGNPVDQWVAHAHHQTDTPLPLRYLQCPIAPSDARETPFERLQRARMQSNHTVVFRDIHLLDLNTQDALAHAITRRQMRRQDGTQLEPVHARIVTTTHLTEQAIQARVHRGDFSAQLWSALRPHMVHIPSFAERTEDLQALIFAALGQACQKLGTPPMGLAPETLQLLMTYPWPGNWVELWTVIHLAVLSAVAGSEQEDRLRPEHLPSQVTARAHSSAASTTEATTHAAGEASAVSTFGRRLDVGKAHDGAYDAYDGTYAELEKQILLHALARAGGNKSEAARRLAIKRSTFIDKLARHGVS